MPTRTLFYRGQKEDYRNPKSGKSTFYPTMYRGNILTKEELKYRWKKLNKASEIFIEKFKSKYPNNKSYIIKRKRIVQWSILQHYEVTETPLIDVTQSLKVACSFAVLDNTNDYAYIYAFALPYYTNRISVNSEHYLTNVRLLSVAPPQALRPYYQEGFLIGEDEFNETYSNKDELDLGNRLVAKFSFKNNTDFWEGSESALTKDELYPKDDEIEQLCKEISKELYERIAYSINNMTGDDYLAFMKEWIKIEKLLSQYFLRNQNNRSVITSAGLIKMIKDRNLRNRLNKARIQRNKLAHNINQEIDIKDLLSVDELQALYSELNNYFAHLHNQ